MGLARQASLSFQSDNNTGSLSDRARTERERLEILERLENRDKEKYASGVETLLRHESSLKVPENKRRPKARTRGIIDRLVNEDRKDANSSKSREYDE